MNKQGHAALPERLNTHELLDLAVTLDCALMAESGECRDTAQKHAVAWVNRLTGPRDWQGTHMNDAVWALWAQVNIETSRRNGSWVRFGPATLDNWQEQGLMMLDDDSLMEDGEAVGACMFATLH